MLSWYVVWKLSRNYVFFFNFYLFIINFILSSLSRLLHRAAGYTSDTTSFHPDTAAKKALLVRAAVRLVTTAAARHKALLTTRSLVFATTIRTALTHMEKTLIASQYLHDSYWRNKR